MDLATLIIVCCTFVVAIVDLVFAARVLFLKRSNDWLLALADEGVALAKQAKAWHVAKKLDYSDKDFETEAMHWVLTRAEGLRIKCDRATAAKLVSLRRLP